MRPPRVFVAGWVGSENLGDELLFTCLRRRLAELGASVVVLSKDPAATERLHGVMAVRPRDARAMLSEIAAADALVLGAGGLLQDGTSVLSLPYHLSRVVMARARGVPFIGLGLGAGPLRFRASRLLLRAALAGHRGISVRDEASAALLRQCGVTEVRVTADLALALDPPQSEPQDRIVLALRSYRQALLPGGSARSRELEGALARALDEVQRRTRLHLRFLAFEGRRDEDFNRHVAARMTATDVSFATPRLDDVLDELAQARLTIAMRYHGGIASVVAERPAVLIGYAPKVAALAAALGDDCRYFAHEAAALQQLPEAVEQLLSRAHSGLRERRLGLRRAELGNRELLEGLLASVDSARARA